MERLRRNTIALGITLACIGAAIQFAPKAQATPGHTETWMETKLPKQVGKYSMVIGDSGAEQTYKMPQATYTELNPYGIVCRVFRSGADMVDVVIISSNRKESFHDPKVCFTAQGWTFGELKEEMIDTELGKIPATVASMTDKNGRKAQTVFFYKDADNYYAAPQSMTWNMLKRRVFFKPNSDGVFYRFIGLNEGMNKEKLNKFISDFLVESKRTSEGAM